MDAPKAEALSTAEEVDATATVGSGGEDGQVLETLHDNGAAVSVSLGDNDRKQPERLGGAPARSTQLPYQDHNYISSSLSTAGASAKSSGGERQCFPTIAGLEEYATAIDGSPQANNGVAAIKCDVVVKQNSPHGHNKFRRTHHPIQAGAHNNMAVNSHRPHPPLFHPRFPTPAGARPTAAIRNSRDYSLPSSGNSPATRRYAVVAGGVQQMPFSPVVGARRVMYPSSSDHQFVSHAPLSGLSPQLIRQQLGQPSPQIIQLRRTVGGGSATTPSSTTPTPAMIASDPSLVANLNAPAPFLAPARGPPTRGRGTAPPITSAGRVVVTSQGAGVPPVRAGSYQQQMVASSYARQPAVSGRAPPDTAISQPLQKDTSINDVLEEEEAQNAQFFQRQMASKKPTAPGAEKHSAPQITSSGSSYPSSSAVATPSAHLRFPPSDNMMGPKQRGRLPAGPIMPPYLLPSPRSNSSSTLVHSESREAALAAAHDFVRQEQQQTAVKSPVKYHIIQTEQHPDQHGPEARQGLPVGRLMQLPQQQQGALEGLAELAQLSQQQQNLFGASTFGGVSPPQRLLARPPHNYANTSAVACLRTASPLKHGQQPQAALPVALSQFGGVDSALLSNSMLTQNASPSNDALMASAPQPDTTNTASPATGASVRPKRTMSAGKDLQSLIKSGKAEANRHQVTTAADWTGQDYTTRCICGMEHDDDFMIECERCNVWQHAVCMDVNQKNVPESYFCEQCSPRPLKLTKEEAASLQREKLKHLENVNSQKTGKTKSKKGTDAKQRVSTNAVKNRQARDSGTASHPKKKNQQHNVPENTLSRSMRAYYNAHAEEISKSAKLNDELLKPLSGDVLNAKQMFVAPNVQGLVSVREIAEKSPIIEYTGYFSLASEATGSKAAHRQFLLSYDDLGERINVDASKLGSPARFARRSCKPNAEICHVLDEEGRLHLVLVSNQKIDYSTEVTIPFDYDYTQSATQVTCACSITQDELTRRRVNFQKRGEKCPVHDFNLVLQGGGAVVAVATALSSNSAPLPSIASPSVADKKSSSQRVETKRNASPPKGVVRKGKGKGKWAKGKKKIPVRGRNSSPTKNKAAEKSPRDLTPPRVKEEAPETRRRTTRTQSTSSNPRGSVTKGAETEAERICPPSKEQPPSTSTKSANPSSSTKMTVEQQQTPPEAQKLSREERKIQDAMALIERQEKREKQKLEKKSPKNPKASHEKSVEKTQTDKETKRKDAVKKPAGGKAVATPPPSKGKSGTPKIAFKLKKLPIAAKQQTSSNAARDSSCEEPELIAPRRAALKRSATAAALAKIQESSRSPVVKKKHLTSSGSRGRDESQMSSTEAAELLADMATGTSTTPTPTAMPSTSSRGDDGGDVNIREELNELAKIATGAGEELFSLTSDYNLMKPSAAGLKTPKDGIVVEKKEEGEDEAPISKFEPATPIIKPIIANTKAVKKLTIDEYKRRRTSGSSMASPVEGGNGAGPSSSSTAANSRHSFIPSLNAPAISLFATPTPGAVVSNVATTSMRQPGTASVRVVSQVPTRQPPPSSSSSSSMPTPSLDELKRRIYGGGSSNQEKCSITGGSGASTKPTPEATKASKAAREGAEGDDEGDEECRTMSLEERLRTQFGVGISSSTRRQQTEKASSSSNLMAATRSSTRLSRESFRQPTAYRQDIPPPGLITLNHVGGSTSTGTSYPPPTPPPTPVEVPPHSSIYPHQQAR